MLALAADAAAGNPWRRRQPSSRPSASCSAIVRSIRLSRRRHWRCRQSPICWSGCTRRPAALRAALMHLLRDLGQRFLNEWRDLHALCRVEGEYRYHPGDAGRRARQPVPALPLRRGHQYRPATRAAAVRRRQRHDGVPRRAGGAGAARRPSARIRLPPSTPATPTTHWYSTSGSPCRPAPGAGRPMPHRRWRACANCSPTRPSPSATRTRSMPCSALSSAATRASFTRLRVTLSGPSRSLP